MQRQQAAKTGAAGRLLQGQRGSVMVYVTLAMVVLLAFGAGVADMGQMYENRRQMQNAMDAAALAGAQELLRLDLPETDRRLLAETAALNYAERNGVPWEQIAPGYPVVDCTDEITTDPVCVGGFLNRVRMGSVRELDLLVARLLNNGVGDVAAVATAVVAPVLPTEGLWPVAVSLCEEPMDWNGDGDTTDCDGPPEGVPIRLKLASPPGTSGNFHPLNWPPSGGGASDYEDDWKYGYGNQPGDYIKPGLPWCGVPEAPACTGADDPYVETEPGNKAGPTWDSIEYLVVNASGDSNPNNGVDPVAGSQDYPSISSIVPTECTWPNAPLEPLDLPEFGGGASAPGLTWVGNASRCYRVGIVPIIYQKWSELGGREPVDIVGWGAFYLVGIGDRDTGQWSGGPSGQKRIWGYFTTTAVVSGGRFSDRETGLWAARLWE